ncbi:MAG: hypothetical protein AAFU03_09905, partial [Bacteroidota bacterium]
GAYRSGGKQSGANRDVNRNSVGVRVNGGPYQELFAWTSTRFYNSQQTKAHQFLTAKGKDGSSKYLFMINKASGEIEKQIELLEKDPGYVVDVVDDVVFLSEKGKLVTAFKM